MEINLTKKRGGEFDTDIRYDWHEISAIYKELYENVDAKGIKEAKLREHLGIGNSYGGDWRTNEGGFYGCTMEELVNWLNTGYEFDTDVDPEMLPTIPFDRPRYRYTDDSEGEFDFDLYSNGETEHFLTKPRRKSVGGIRLKINYDFNCNVSSETVAKYLEWVGHVIQSLQARGYDLEIELFTDCEGSFTKSRHDQQSIRVSKFGERVMPFDWSALFSPGGFRHFMFLALMWPCEKHPDLVNSYGLGRAKDHNWDIEWEPKEREIIIWANSNGNNFPLEEMTKRFESWKE